MKRWSWLSLRCPPSDRLVLVLLALSVVVAGVRLPYTVPQGPLAELLWIQVGLLLGFAAVVAVIIRYERAALVRFLRPVATVTVIFTCYTTLGKLGVTAMPYLADHWLSALDTDLLGSNPTFVIEAYLTPGRVEFFSFFYGAFIPYVYITIALNCVGQPPLQREQFLTGWVMMYFLSYLGYIFLPARGPGFFHEAEYTVALTGGTFYKLVLDGIETTGGLQGAFPSLHVGGSLYLCLFELRVNRLRGLIYVPLVLLIYAATLVLRYHYVVDLIVGTILAVGCLPLGRLVFYRWAARREAAGLPALPGGEMDVLPDLPHPGGPHAGTRHRRRSRRSVFLCQKRPGSARGLLSQRGSKTISRKGARGESSLRGEPAPRPGLVAGRNCARGSARGRRFAQRPARQSRPSDRAMLPRARSCRFRPLSQRRDLDSAHDQPRLDAALL
jgi:hypothetical protein